MKVAQYLAAHDGVITTADAVARGMTPSEIEGRVRAGLWSREGRCVFLSVEHELTDAARIRIVVATYGGVIDRASAAWWHGLITTPPADVQISVGRSARPQQRCGAQADSKRRSYPAEDVMTLRGVAVTSLELTVLQASAELDDGIALMDRALQTKCVTVASLRKALDRNSGSHGMRRARLLLTAAADLSESQAERLFVKILREYGITGWTHQMWVAGLRADFGWAAERIAVEIHGWRWHKTKSQWERDQRWINLVHGVGWVPLVFTWERLTTEPEVCMAELCAAIETRQSAA
ncbi:type IV toxin-antitoxin system AbiEi family antitoxin domain-containing protein [Gordonia malaquae]|uniref:type IV toxin-antitoxin system AbiEi family antitoxin domain-containing protein n=1 Tax=Gordonia malaquae TaxID=410332 RepID=UPI0030FE3D41